jgi:hypothetical protein
MRQVKYAPGWIRPRPKRKRRNDGRRLAVGGARFVLTRRIDLNLLVIFEAIITGALSCDILPPNPSTQHLIMLGVMKVAKDGPTAQREANTMIGETKLSGIEAAAKLAGGSSLGSVVRHYHTIVDTNEKRPLTIKPK